MPRSSAINSNSSIPFIKMHGLGNDFVVFDNREGQIPTDPASLQYIADRNIGIGCDQILMLTLNDDPDYDFGYAIYNADGSSVGQCGNGARCLAHFIHHQGISKKNSLQLKTTTTSMEVKRLENEHYAVTMPSPSFKPSQIPFTPQQPDAQAPYLLEGFELPCYLANVGNPHAIFAIDDAGNSPEIESAYSLSVHQQFPEGANISLMKKLSDNHITILVYERGAGPTLACGSAACAAMAVGKQHLGLADDVTVTLPGGDLKISWKGGDHPLTLTGPSTLVFEGSLFFSNNAPKE